MLYEIRNSTSVRRFLDYYQEVAEYEGRLKVKRLENDLPKYLTHQNLATRVLNF